MVTLDDMQARSGALAAAKATKRSRYSDLKKYFSDEEIIELALLCAETDGVGKFARSLRIRTWEEACSIQPLLKQQAVAAEAAE